MCDCGGAEHPLSGPADPCDDTMFLLQHMCDCGGAEHPLPVPADPRDGPLGEAGLHPDPSSAPYHGEASTAPTVSSQIYFKERSLQGVFHCGVN